MSRSLPAVLVILPATVSLFFGFAVEADAEPVPVQRPSFCEGHPATAGQDRYVTSAIGKEGMTDNAVNRMAMAACDAPDDPKRQQEMAGHRKVLMERWGISAAMTLDSLKIRLDLPAYKNELAAFCKKSKHVADASDRENAENAAWSRAVGCDNSDNFSWYLDEQAETSQVWRLAMTLACYSPKDDDKFDLNDEFTNNMKSASQLTRYARCGLDVRRLDRGKLDAELDRVIAVERKASVGTSANKGCAAKLRPGFARYVATRKVQGKDDFAAIGMDSFGVRWLRALGYCEQVDGNPSIGVYLSRQARSGSSRGPRVEAEQAAAARIAEARAGNPRFSDDGKSFFVPGESDGAKPLDSFKTVMGFISGSGVIGSVEPKGEQVVISFKTVSWSQPRWICHDSDKIDRVDFQTGKIQYKQSCKEDGVEKLTSQERPIEVPTFYSSSLKAGQFLTFVAPGIEPRDALPLVGYADTKQAQAVSVYGLKP